ncbi:MAG: lysozyme [Methylococcales bacterium]
MENKVKLILSLLPVVGLVLYMSLNKKKVISKNGLDLLKQFEGWRAQVYLDSANLPTIGYGHLLKDNETYFMINKMEGEALLKQDVSVAETAVNKMVSVNLSQNMFDALVSFVYNVGAGAFKASTLLRVLNAGDYQEAQRQLAVWNKITVDGVKIVSQGLVYRRKQEQNLFFA